MKRSADLKKKGLIYTLPYNSSQQYSDGGASSLFGIDWWLRNDPPLIRIPSPAGNFEPDFVYHAIRGPEEVHGLLEIKGDIFWDGEGSDARVKAEAACRWAAAIQEARSGVAWEFGVVLEQDALRADSLESMLSCAVQRSPPAAVSKT